MQRIRLSMRRRPVDGVRPRVLVACSGGRDSIVLAHLLSILARTGELDAEIAHIDHGVRPGSMRDASVVQEFAHKLGMPFQLRRLGAGVLARHTGVGLEEALRRERYRELANVAADIGADLIALGHHQRDQAETVLLHLIRGAGLGGASGMREWSTLGVPWWEGGERSPLILWRPLLAEPVSVIESWHRHHQLPCAEDETNSESVFRRNAVRHEVLPVLEQIAPGATASLARFAGLAADDDAVLEGLARELLSQREGNTLRRGLILDAGPAIQRRLIRQWILEHGYDGEVTRNRIEAVCDLARRNRSGAAVEIGNGWVVRLDRGELSVAREMRVP